MNQNKLEKIYDSLSEIYTIHMAILSKGKERELEFERVLSSINSYLVNRHLCMNEEVLAMNLNKNELLIIKTIVNEYNQNNNQNIKIFDSSWS